MFWNKKPKNAEYGPLPTQLEAIVEEGPDKNLVFDTYVAATNMPDVFAQRFGYMLIGTYLSRLSMLSSAYTSISSMVSNCRKETKKAIINQIGSLPYPDTSEGNPVEVMATADLFLLARKSAWNWERPLQIEEIREGIGDYFKTKSAMFDYAYELTPKLIGKHPSELRPKLVHDPDS